MRGQSQSPSTTQRDTEKCREFVDNYYRLSNARPDLLYRLYSVDAKISVSETVRGKNRNIHIKGSGPKEIRSLLPCILDRIQSRLINVDCQPSISDQTHVVVNGLINREASRVDHFFTQSFMLIAIKSRFVIVSDTLQIFSHNSRTHVLDNIQPIVSDHLLHRPSDFSHPEVVDTKIRSRVHLPLETPVDPEVDKLLVAVNETEQHEPAATFAVTMKVSTPYQSEERIEPDTAKESASDEFRARGWNTFSRGKPVYGDEISEETFRASSQYTLSKENDDGVLNTMTTTTTIETRMAEKAETTTKTPNCTQYRKGEHSDKLFLKCFEKRASARGIETDVACKYSWRGESASKHQQKPAYTGAFLRLFGNDPVPDGPPVEWDLSHDAVSTPLKRYQDVVDPPGMPLPTLSNRSSHSKDEWFNRTVFLSGLPLDIHPDSLRQAYECAFGEIEDDYGIILASAERSSVAYIVFKSIESARAVGRADSWVHGTKIVIQKYKAVTHMDSSTNES